MENLYELNSSFCGKEFERKITGQNNGLASQKDNMTNCNEAICDTLRAVFTLLKSERSLKASDVFNFNSIKCKISEHLRTVINFRGNLKNEICLVFDGTNAFCRQ